MSTLSDLHREPVGLVGEHLFVEPPFLPSANARFAFGTESHARALEAVTNAISRWEDLIAITGDEGTGKTTLCVALSQRFDPRTSVSIILDPRFTGDNLLHKVLVDFGAASTRLSDRSGGDPHTALAQFLASLVPSQRHAVVVIDDAQDLSPSVLVEMLRAANFQANRPGLQFVLVGGPNLEDVLRQADLGGRGDRKISRHCLTPIADDRGVKQYIERRLWIARNGIAALSLPTSLDQRASGARNRLWWPRFTRSAIGVIARASLGNPRTINLICDRALSLARVDGKDHISARLTRRAVADLGLRAGFRHLWRPSPKMTAAVLVTSVAGALITVSLTNSRLMQTISPYTPNSATSTPGRDQAFEVFRTNVLERAVSLSIKPDVKGLLKLQEEVQRWDAKAEPNHQAIEGLLVELERFIYEARVRQLAVDQRLFLEASRTP